MASKAFSEQPVTLGQYLLSISCGSGALNDVLTIVGAGPRRIIMNHIGVAEQKQEQ